LRDCVTLNSEDCNDRRMGGEAKAENDPADGIA
jgi:hypothetical protein